MKTQKVRRNEFEHSIGEEWAREFFANRINHGFITSARSHELERNHNGAKTEVAFKPSDLKRELDKLREIGGAEKDLVIVRTYKQNGKYNPLYSFLVVVPQAILEEYQNQNTYFRYEGPYGKDYWEQKSRGLVRYFSIPKSFLALD